MHKADIVKAFTRPEVMRLTGLTIDQIKYLGRTSVAMIVGHRVGRGAVYDFSQLVELRAIADLRDQGLSLQKIRKARNYLLNTFGLADLRDRCFVIWNGELHLIENNAESKAAIVMAVTGKGAGQVVITGLVETNQVLLELDELSKVANLQNWKDRRDYWIGRWAG
jgi:hypothetical protein